MSQIEVDKVIPQSGTALQVGESGDTITIPAGATITNNGTANGFGSADTEKVKVSANDTTAGFLNGKLVAGTNISLTEGTDGGNETLTAALSGTIATAQIADDAVTAAKLNNDIISGSTELASEPADTDEFLVSDAGTLKRIDYSLIKGSGAVELIYSGNLSTAVFNIDNVFSTSHRVYKIFVDGAYPSSDGEMQFNFRSGGASGAIQNAAAYRFTGVRQERQSSGSGTTVTIANDSWGLSYVRLGQSLESSNAEYTMNLELTVYNPIDTKPTYFTSISSQMDSSGSWVVGYHNNGIYWNNTSITGIALNTQSGQWSGGKVRVYGYKES